jgi:hypothetical protein
VFVLEILDPTCGHLEYRVFIFNIYIEKPAALLSLLNVNEGREEVNEHEDLKNKLNLMASKAIIDMVI